MLGGDAGRDGSGELSGDAGGVGASYCIVYPAASSFALPALSREYSWFTCSTARTRAAVLGTLTAWCGALVHDAGLWQFFCVQNMPRTSSSFADPS